MVFVDIHELYLKAQLAEVGPGEIVEQRYLLEEGYQVLDALPFGLVPCLFKFRLG